MAYLNNIPQANQRLKDSQPQLLGNFQAIKALIDINHVTFGDPNEGKHKFVSFPVQGAAPTTAVGEMALYTKSVAGVPGLYVRQESNGTETPFGGAASGSVAEYQYLSSGLLMKWGTDTTTTAGTPRQIPYNANLPHLNAFQVGIALVSVRRPNNGSSPNVSIYVDSSSPWTVLGFNGAGTAYAANVGYTYLVIGVPA